MLLFLVMINNVASELDCFLMRKGKSKFSEEVDLDLMKSEGLT